MTLKPLTGARLAHHKAIYDRRQAGETLKSIATDYGVSGPRIWQIEQRYIRFLRTQQRTAEAVLDYPLSIERLTYGECRR